MELMLGNEAIARGAWEAGVRVATAYPGTPSTEITENLGRFGDIYTEWATNEKVALEVAIGAAIGGARALCCMKHVGVNVAADPLFTVAYTGIRGGLVIVAADDPGMHSSQNEQDSRFYARAAHIPMLEPADSQEALEFMKRAFEMSEAYDTPVFLRLTTRISHSRSLVRTGERVLPELLPYTKDVQKYVMMPGMARGRHKVVEARMNRLSEDANEMDLHRVEWHEKKLGVVCSGMAYQYVREALPEASVFKLGLVYPIPLEAIRAFSREVEELLVIEELEPFFENQLKAHGIACHGKSLTGHQGELSAARLRALFHGEPQQADPGLGFPQRPPVLCPGCPHRGAFHVLSRLGAVVTGDIGCYTLGTLAPLNGMDACVCMGASIGMAMGLEKARGKDFARKLVAVIGDSTFLHSGLTGLVDMIYNQGSFTVLILDNSTTGMTGHQPHAATGMNAMGGEAPKLSLDAVIRGMGIEPVVADPFDLKGLEAVLKTEMAKDAPSVVIARRPCALLDRSPKTPCVIEDCRNCKRCLKLGCPALEGREDGVHINPALCNGCGLCEQLCAFHAIRKGDAK